MIRKIIMLLSVLSVIVVVLLCCITRASYTDQLKKNANYDTYAVKHITTNANTPDFSALETADIVAKVMATGQREQQYMCTLSFAEVEAVYKGDASLTGQEIGIYEPNTFDYIDNEYVYLNRSFFNLMKEKHEYYVFLYRKEYVDYYQNTLDCLIFSSIPDLYSIIPVQTGSGNRLSQAASLMYKDVKDCDYVCQSETEANRIEHNTDIVRDYIFNIENNNINVSTTQSRS